MSSEFVRLNDVLRRAVALPTPFAAGSASAGEISRSYATTLAAGYEILGQLELFAGILREEKPSALALLLVPDGVEARRAVLMEARNLLDSLVTLHEDLRQSVSVAPSAFAGVLADLWERLSAVTTGFRSYVEEEAGRLALTRQEPLFPARPSPMTAEEVRIFRRDLRKRTDRILAALAE